MWCHPSKTNSIWCISLEKLSFKKQNRFLKTVQLYITHSLVHPFDPNLNCTPSPYKLISTLWQSGRRRSQFSIKAFYLLWWNCRMCSCREREENTVPGIPAASLMQKQMMKLIICQLPWWKTQHMSRQGFSRAELFKGGLCTAAIYKEKTYVTTIVLLCMVSV